MSIFNKTLNKYFLSLVIIFTVNIEKCNSLCGNTFSRASASVHINGNREPYLANKCVRGVPIESFQLLSSTETIYPGTFSNLFYLHTIELNGVSITRIDPGFLENIPAIRYIKIERNRLQTIGKYTFDYLRLRVLDFSSNLLSEISEDAFENSDYQYLCLSNNKLDHVNPNWFRNTTITALSMTHNQVTKLDNNTFSNIKDLKTIKLNYNKIHEIGYQTFSTLDTLQIIYLSANTLEDVSFEIKNNLRNIDISFNKITSLNIDEFTSLWIMSIYPNPFECACLRDFWKFADRKHIQLWDSKTLKQPWKDEYPLCIAQNPQCYPANSNLVSLPERYLKIINYNVLGQPKYVKENDFLDLGIVN